MPSDKVTLFPDFPNTFQGSLTSYGISTFRPAGGDGVMNFYAPSTIDDIAPFGNDLYWDANTYTFSEPVFAVGFTFIATDYPNSDAPGSFDNNVQNISHEVRAYGENGNLIENAFSSSWTIHTGPRHFYIGGGLDFVASYAGIWTDTPIYSVSFGGIRPTDGALMATYGSFSFSRTPLTITVNPYQDEFVIIAGSGKDQSNGKLFYIPINPDGTFGTPSEVGDLGYRSGAGIADFDNDGDLDFVAGAREDTSATAHIFICLKTLATVIFSKRWIASVPAGRLSDNKVGTFAVADFNGDGFKDFVVPIYRSNSHLPLY